MVEKISKEQVKQISGSQLRSEEEIITSWKGDIDKPLVSINCITYNHAPYIEDALIGFLRQETTFPIEVLVHDDASSDDTVNIIKRYVKLYPRIIKPLYQRENQYSKGIRPVPTNGIRAKGKYSCICEGDDYWIDSHKLQRQTEVLDTNLDIDLCIHPAFTLIEKSGEVVLSFSRGREPTILDGNEAVISKNQFSPTASYFFRTRKFRELPKWFFDQNDLPFGDYFIESILGKNGIYYIPDVMSVYRSGGVGSYTIRTSKAKTDALVTRMLSVIFYTKQLKNVPRIKRESIDKRCEEIYMDYINLAKKRFSYRMYSKIISSKSKIGLLKENKKFISVFDYFLFFIKSLLFLLKRVKTKFL